LKGVVRADFDGLRYVPRRVWICSVQARWRRDVQESMVFQFHNICVEG
jgi:hypothetical protein